MDMERTRPCPRPDVFQRRRGEKRAACVALGAAAQEMADVVEEDRRARR